MFDRFKNSAKEWAKEAAKDPLRVPWSGERVSTVVRIGAAFLSLCFLAATIFGALPYVTGGKLLELSIEEAVNAFLFAYALVLFSRVALTGRAPASWLPWR